MSLPPEMPPEAGRHIEKLWFLPSPTLQSSTRAPHSKNLQATSWQRSLGQAVPCNTEQDGEGQGMGLRKEASD